MSINPITLLNRVLLPVVGYTINGAIMTLQCFYPLIVPNGLITDFVILDATTTAITYYNDANSVPYKGPYSMNNVLRVGAYPNTYYMGEEVGGTILKTFDPSNMFQLSTATVTEAILSAAVASGRGYLRSYLPFPYPVIAPTTIYPSKYN
jgi:hypothetical protein